ncbi:unnamed protein product [Phaedon cochleariae]|uniref:Galectin n=1 Tax=Phaedon cochleariae TaxID=80249 RepID=A0A9P0GQI7_PHACE|nr:unnamed protein product [Phaedon cochleariae]
MSRCHILSKAKSKRKGTCAKVECKCDRNICFCETLHAPFTDKLPENLTPGTCIVIDGLIKEDCPRFAINLACSEEGDVGLHINPRLFQKFISRNCRINGKWQVPEVTSIAKFQLARNQSFRMSILITTKEFLIAIDGKHFCGYVFRFSPEHLQILQVLGSIKVLKVDYQDLEEYPPEFPTVVPVVLTMGKNLFAASGGEVDLPLAAFLAKGFRKDFQIEINGKIKMHPCGFFLNLQETSRVWPLPNLHLHINFIFNVKQGKHSVLVNSRIDEVWRDAVIVPRLYLQPTSVFNIAIHRSSENFIIWLDGELLDMFEIATTNVDLIDTLYIQGDISIYPPMNITIRK